MATTSIPSQNLPQTSLYVGDLHPMVTESLLYATFSSMGHVLSARVCRDVALHTSLGYGYVNFEAPKDADRALENLNYEDLLGRQIRIMWCQRDPSLRKSGRGNIFIKNLDKNIAQKDLYDTFCHFGKILSCKIAIDDTGASKGYGFIHFQDEDCADAAIKAVNAKMINERIVFVGPFIPKSERKSASGKSRFTNCYVKNFGDEMSDKDLSQMFAPYGDIKSCCVMRDAEGKSKGFGFVCFGEHDMAEAAVQALNGKESKGHTLYVNRAQRKTERQEVLRQHFEKQRAERLSKYAAGINLYVKNLDDSIDDARLKDAFGVFGKITSAKVMTDNVGHSKGFGFVCFTTPDEAKEAVSMNGNLLGSKPLYVALAQRREDRRAKLFAEHQQRLQYRTNVGNMPTAASMNYFGTPAFPPTQRFFHAAPALASQPRWNRPGMGAPQVQMAHPGLGTAMRPTMGAPYVGNNAAMAAMTQNQMAQQFRGQPATRGIVSGMQPGMNAGSLPNGNIIAPGAGGPHQQYNGQRSNMNQLVGSGNVPRATMAAVTASVRPSSGNQMQRQMLQANVQGANAANVRFHQNARNVAAQPGRVPMRPAAVGDQPYNMAVSGLNDQDQKQYLGEQIFRKVEKICPEQAGKITGMLIGMDTTELYRMVDSDEFLHEKVQEGISVLKKRDEVASAALEPAANSTGQTGDSARAEPTEVKPERS